MRGRGIAVALALVIAACGASQPTDSTPPPPASAEELAAVCERYGEVRDLEIGEMWEAIREVAPAEIEAPLARLTSGSPGERYWDDRDLVEEFLGRCD